MPKIAPASGGFTTPLRFVARGPKTTQNTCGLRDAVNALNQNGRSLRRPEIGHACNSTQAHMQGKQREWELCNRKQGSSTHKQFWEALAWGLAVTIVCPGFRVDLQSFYPTVIPRHLISISASSLCV